MDRSIAFLFQYADRAADVLAFLSSRWPHWLLQEPRPLHKSMRDDWSALVHLCGDDNLATSLLALSAVASVSQRDGSLYEADRPEAQRRLQAAFDVDVISNRESEFSKIVRFYELAEPIR